MLLQRKRDFFFDKRDFYFQCVKNAISLTGQNGQKQNGQIHFPNPPKKRQKVWRNGKLCLNLQP